VFRRFDKDKNGTISAENLGKVMQALGQDVTQEDVRSMIQDYDKSGKLTYCLTDVCRPLDYDKSGKLTYCLTDVC
jgi:Ca2+-binding EF-hand superfamily protein